MTTRLRDACPDRDKHTVDPTEPTGYVAWHEWFTQTVGRQIDSRDDLTVADLALLGAALDKLDQNATAAATDG